MKSRSSLFILLRAAMTQDMQLFNVKKKDLKSTGLKRFIVPVLLGLLIMFCVGVYAYMLAEALSTVGETRTVLTIFIALVSILTLIEGAYKSGSMLFDCKDNDLLFSLPIPKSTIFTVRVLKLVLFQLCYNLIFLLPAFVVYVIFEHPGFGFYPLSLLFFILLPLLPTTIGVLIGYIVKSISSRFQIPKVVQALLTLVFVLLFIAFTSNSEGMLDSLSANAVMVNEKIGQIFYPAGAYLTLLEGFNLGTFLGLIAFCVIPFVAIVIIGSLNYFKIISRNRIGYHSKNIDLTNKSFHMRSPFGALVHKELSRYFSSVVYMVNTLPSILIILIIAIALALKGNGVVTEMAAAAEVSPDFFLPFLPKVYLLAIMFTACTTSITSSSISIEGKSINITKSLPVSTLDIFRAKAFASLIITVPPLLIANFIVFIALPVPILDMIIILVYSILLPLISALVGIQSNLKRPKLDAANDTEIIKQSSSSILSTLIGMAILILSAAFLALTLNYFTISAFVEIAIYIIAILLLWRWLKTDGVRRFQDLSI